MQPVFPTLSATPLQAAQQAMLGSLENKTFFKLIGGGSLTESSLLAEAAKAYALAGADCIDITPEPQVLAAVSRTLALLPAGQQPVVMVSIPLDADPHFRKIDLDESACIACALCVPVCPTDAFALGEALEITQSLCYGCGRCVPVCPTEALSLHPFHVTVHLQAALTHPAVGAIEIHSRYADPYMLASFFERWGMALQDKLIALCFRPQLLAVEQSLAFIEAAAQFSPFPLILQVDGEPMSGTADREASLPALQAAADFFPSVAARFNRVFATVSGGINAYTADYLQQADYCFIAGVGMGTIARQAVWQLPPEEALLKAGSMIQRYKRRGKPLQRLRP